MSVEKFFKKLNVINAKKVGFILAVSIMAAISLTAFVAMKITIQRNWSFKEVKIGNQIWMAENLNVDKFQNGDPIPQAKTDKEWIQAGLNKQPVWCYYNNNLANGTKYGKLYNWYAVNDPRGLAPEGWKIPAPEDWFKLIKYLGDDAGKKLKSTTGWGQEKYKGTNSSGFSGRPGGIITTTGVSIDVGINSTWWASKGSEGRAWTFGLRANHDGDWSGTSYMEEGASVRCFMDVPLNVTYSLKKDEVKIENQVWMTANLNVVNFRNGDPIPQAITNEEWGKASDNKKPAWCYFNNGLDYGSKYGKLYNWYAVNDPRGLAPEGWHIPSDAEWNQLIDNLGGASIAGKIMKSKKGWSSNGTNESGFSGLPGGIRTPQRGFDNYYSGAWWSSTKGDTYVLFRYISGDKIARDSASMGGGVYVRCIKDIPEIKVSDEPLEIGVSILESNSPPTVEEAPKNDEIFTRVEHMPQFGSGEKDLLEYLSKSIIYPPAARENGIQGTVVIQFVIDKYGRVTVPVVVREVGGGCDEEALRVINNMPKWIPGKHQGQVVNVRYTMPVRFRLE